ncbi:MAG: peptidoglycan DD-metalloendopeptidase family protein [Synechococcus sp.]
MLSFIPPDAADTSAVVEAANKLHARESSPSSLPALGIGNGILGGVMAALAITVSLVGSSSVIASPNSDRNPIYVAETGDTLEQIASRYGVTVAAVQAVNGETLPASIPQGEEVTLPWVPSVMVHPDFSTGADRGWRTAALRMLPQDFDSNLHWPVTGSISSRYGWRWGRMHRGLDIAGPVGTPIEAAMDGVVSFAGWDRGGYGYRVDISHPNGMTTLYAHGQQILVDVGDRVSRGQSIMTRGSTGRSTGPHLHFEIRRNGVAVDPETMLNGSRPVASENGTTEIGVGGAIEH